MEQRVVGQTLVRGAGGVFLALMYASIDALTGVGRK